MWGWLRSYWRRRRIRREARRQESLDRWLKDNPEKIKVDERRLKEWNRNRGH